MQINFVNKLRYLTDFISVKFSFFDQGLGWVLFLPQIVLVAAILGGLLWGLFIPQPVNKDVQQSFYFYNNNYKRFFFLFLSTYLLIIVLLLNHNYYTGGESYLYFNNLFINDTYTTYVKLFLTIFASIVLFLSYNYFKDNFFTYEFFVIYSFVLLGLFCLVESFDFLSVYLSYELIGLSLYTLCAIKSLNNSSTSWVSGKYHLEGAFKYFILGALASGLLLLSISLFYGLTKTTNFLELKLFFNYWEVFNLKDSFQHLNLGLQVAFFLLMLSLVFKLAAAPFHLWAIDVYQGIPTIVTAFLMTVVKFGFLSFLVRLLYYLFFSFSFQWQPLLVAIGLTSLLFGCLGALYQKNIKRLIVYSSVTNLGFLFLGLSLSTHLGLNSFFLYLLIYVFTNLGFFAFLLIFTKRYNIGTSPETLVSVPFESGSDPDLGVGKGSNLVYFLVENKQLKEKGGFTRTQLNYLTDLRLITKSQPILAFFFTIILLSLAGIPPLAGFWGKYFLFYALFFSKYWWLIFATILISAISAFYYLRLVKILFFDKKGGNFYNLNSSFSEEGNWAENWILLWESKCHAFTFRYQILFISGVAIGITFFFFSIDFWVAFIDFWTKSLKWPFYPN